MPEVYVGWNCDKNVSLETVNSAIKMWQFYDCSLPIPLCRANTRDDYRSNALKMRLEIDA